ncbi:chaperone NapD [uncultured Adlercreutzia sp.]|uniref:chaperone NapD n=1 Tax=uncultured Adlercreutzia sp. TaxID=875803 RepID=UPI0026760A0F|nr:chaperone NapD [uncultured Adlercreutzia sp.]
MEDEKLVISSLIVEARPEAVPAVADALAALEGVEVHEVNGYKIVVTIEAPSTGASHEVSSRMVSIPGVLNVNLVYVNFEDEVL